MRGQRDLLYLALKKIDILPLPKTYSERRDITLGWQSVCRSAQASLLESIPAMWRIDTDSYANLTDVTRVPLMCGILSEQHIAITNLTVTELAKQIQSRELKATEVLNAFAARAAVAHQLASGTAGRLSVQRNADKVTGLLFD